MLILLVLSPEIPVADTAWELFYVFMEDKKSPDLHHLQGGDSGKIVI